jgi:hypothetical protein
MKITAKSAIKEVMDFINNQDYKHIDLYETYKIDKNIYDLVIHQGVEELLDDYLEFLSDNLKPVCLNKAPYY